MWQTRSLEKFEATALAVNGVLYTVQAPNDLVALDAATGASFWTYSHTPAADARTCCGRVNRGVAILGDTLFMGTIDAHLLAIDARSGQLIWDTIVAKSAERYSITHAPLVVKDKVHRRHRGRRHGHPRPDRGLRRQDRQGSVALLHDSRTGRARQRHLVGQVVDDGRRRRLEHRRLRSGDQPDVLGHRQPRARLGRPQRLGDNLYSNSVVALDADTGTLKWHYQFTPHDELDYDSTQVPLLADIQWQGEPRKVMLWANRNGVMYVLDRRTGEFLKGKPYVKVNWMDGFDAKGRPRRVPGKLPTRQGTLIQPHVHGATNWQPPSFSPRTGLVLPGALREQRDHGRRR